MKSQWKARNTNRKVIHTNGLILASDAPVHSDSQLARDTSKFAGMLVPGKIWHSSSLGLQYTLNFGSDLFRGTKMSQEYRNAVDTG